MTTTIKKNIVFFVCLEEIINTNDDYVPQKKTMIYSDKINKPNFNNKTRHNI